MASNRGKRTTLQEEIEEYTAPAGIPKLLTAKSKLKLEHLVKVNPMTENQSKVFDLFDNTDQHLALLGYPGTGKSFLSMYLALRAILRDRRYKKIVVVRSAVPTREQGFLPGTLEEKEDAYKIPYIDIAKEILHPEIQSPLEKMEEQKLFLFKSTSYLRGSTIKDAVIIFDECQNATWQEAHTVISRVGEGSRLILCGDRAQTDLVKKNDESGFDKLNVMVNNMDEFDVVKFHQDDIVRSAFVKSWIVTAAKLGYI